MQDNGIVRKYYSTRYYSPWQEIEVRRDNIKSKKFLMIVLISTFHDEGGYDEWTAVFTFLWKMEWLIDYPCINSWSLFSRSFPPPFHLLSFFFLSFLSGKFSYWMKKIDCAFLCREYWLSCFAGKILSRGYYWRYDNILGNEISVIWKYMIWNFVQ